jgi:enoyl-CoA hydratase/carnithine racemase
MSHVVTASEGAVLRIQLNRPEKKNALTVAMYAALSDAIERADADPAVRVMLLHGAGDAFTAGNDLQDFAAAAGKADAERPAGRFLQVISHAAKPIVAAVQGSAVGIGTTMLLHCDFAYAADSARFHLPFVNLSICPEAASSFLLPMWAGYARAAKLLMLGEPFSAAEAHAAGFVTEVVPAAEVLAAAEATARKLAEKPPRALRLVKQLMRRPLMPHIEATMAEELRHFMALIKSPEAKEAFAAFFEKRKPDFSRFS